MSLSSDDRVYGTTPPMFEGLEERLLLTTLVGGQTAEFWAPETLDPDDPLQGHTIRISLEGDIIAEFMAVGISSGNQVNVGDLPVNIISSGTGVHGGLGGLDGVELIGDTPITDPTGQTPGVVVPEVDPDNFGQIQALASESFEAGGKTYGLNLWDDNTIKYVQLLEINNDTGDATVVADLTYLLPFSVNAQTGLIESDVTAITGADFRPMDGTATAGWLYFVAALEPDGVDPSYELYAIDVHQPRSVLQNLNPIAIGDNYATMQDVPVVADVLGNDLDPDNDPLTIDSFSQGGNGTVVDNGNGTLTYTPNAGFSGSDTFTYTISDGNGGTSSETVRVTVVAALYAVGDVVATTVNTPVTTHNVLDNDETPAGLALSVTTYTNPANGYLDYNGDGTFTYTPYTDFIGSDSFTYTITDGAGTTSTATVDVTVAHDASLPLAVDDAVGHMGAGAGDPIDVLANDWAAAGHPVTIQSSTLPANGTVVDNGDGTFTYTPNLNFVGTDSFDYTITDGAGNISIATVNITVVDGSGLPLAINDATAHMGPGPVITANVLANDLVAAGRTPVIQSFTQPAHGAVVYNNNGTFTFTPNDGNFVGFDAFDYTVSDGAGGVSTATVNIVVGHITDLPLAVDDMVAQMGSGAATTADVLANDLVAGGRTLVIQSFTQPANGVVVDNGDGTFTYTPNAGHFGSDSFTYTVNDGAGHQSTATVHVEAFTPLLAVNDRIGVTLMAPLTTPNVLSNDLADPSWTVAVDTNPQHGTVVYNGGGTFTYTPANNYQGDDSFTYIITDAAGGTSTATVFIDLMAVTATNKLFTSGTLATGQDDPDVTSIAWEENNGVSTLYGAFVNDSGTAEIRTIAPGSLGHPAVISTLCQVLFAGEDGTETDMDGLDGLSGIEFVGDDPYEADRYLYATLVDDAESLLLRIDLWGDLATVAGDTVAMGRLHGWNPVDPTDTRYPANYNGSVRGDNIQGLAWNPVMVNPFTGGYGVMIATDVETDELVYIRTGSAQTPPTLPMLYGWTYNFAIYISHAGDDASISIAAVDDDVSERPLVPFSDGLQNVYINDAQTGQVLLYSAVSNTGNTILGAQTMDYIKGQPGPEHDQATIIISAYLGVELGVRPEHYDDWADDADDLSAGLVVAETILEYYSSSSSVAGRLLGANLDDIREMAVSRSGQIVVVDYDGVDAAGFSYYDDGDGMWNPAPGADTIVGAQISYVDPTTGWATDDDPADGLNTAPMNIVDNASGLAIRGVWGLDYGDVYMNGNEELYAVCSIGYSRDLWLGTITMDYAAGQATFDGLVRLVDGNGDRLEGVQTMAFSPGQGSIVGQQGLYLVDSDSRLFELDPVTGATLTGGDVVTTVLANVDGTPVVDDEGAFVTETVTVESMDFDDDGVLYAMDRRSGRLVDIDLAGLGSGVVAAGLQTATTVGSLRPTVGAISYDFANDRFLAVDNVMGQVHRDDESSWDADNSVDLRTNDSSALMVLLGTDSDSAVGQNINTFLYGGVVAGKVDISGSIDTFYAGWLLTGRPGPTPPTDGTWTGGNYLASGLLEGAVDGSAAYVADNFHVGGDLRNLIVGTSIGIDSVGAGVNGRNIDTPTYLTGFDLQVDGKLGQLWTMDGMASVIAVENQKDVVQFDSPVYQEIETFVSSTLRAPSAYPESDAFGVMDLYRLDGAFLNDTMATAQYLGSSQSALGESDTIAVVGDLGQEDPSDSHGDSIDYYAVALMAGQTITVQMTELSGLVDVGVFDPDGRLIATDRNDVNDEATHGAPFRVTADRAGVYYFAIGGAPFDGTTTYSGFIPYALTIDFEDEATDLALGGIRIDGSMLNYGDNEPVGPVPPTPMDSRLKVTRGDLGAIVVGGAIVGGTLEVATDDTAVPPRSIGQLDILVEAGDLRAIQAGSFGAFDASASNGQGGVGTFTDGLYIDVHGGDVGLLRTTDAAGVMFLNAINVEGDLQTLDAAYEVWIDLSAWGGLGNFRAGSMTSDVYGDASSIRLNTDEYGRDGVLDLMDIAGDLGNPAAGGPYIYTGEGGNVRFMRVGGEVFQNQEWADSTPVDTNVDPGEPITLWDDSGAKITLFPMPDTLDAAGMLPVDPLTGQYMIDPATQAPFVQPSLNVTYYGINDSGGVVILDVTSTENLYVQAESNDNGAAAEISRITVNGEGRAVVVDAVTGAMSLANQPYAGFETNLSVVLESVGGVGAAPIDVFDIVGGNFTAIRNLTGGDIVGVHAASIGTIETHGSLGVTSVYNDAEIDGIADLSDALPFSQQTTGLVSGDIITARADKAVGNFIVSGSIGDVYANYNGQVDHTDGQYNGVVAPIYASGDIRLVNIGEGVAPSGTGNYSFAGIYADGVIHRVVNQGLGSDIHGDIIGTLGIDQIYLEDGAIIEGDIFATTFGATNEYSGGAGLYTGDIKEILIRGDGGIVGSYIRASNIDSIRVEGGFGLFSSWLASTGGDGTIKEVLVDGYGLYNVLFTGGAYVGDVIATGKGDVVSTLDYTPTVRYSQEYAFDPMFGRTISVLNDIHAVLGTSATAPDSVEGVWQTVDASAQLNLTKATGFLFNDVQLTFANRIGLIETIDTVDGLRVVTGHVEQFKPGSDVYGLDMNVAGEITKIVINGDLADSSSIAAYGSNGSIKRLIVHGDFDGELLADGNVGTVTIDGDLSGAFDIDDTNETKFALKKLDLGGSLRNGSLDINGSVGTIRVAGDLGVEGDTLHIEGDLGNLYVGADKNVDGSGMNLDLSVAGDLGNLDVTGALTGDVYVGGTLKSLAVRADEATTGGDVLTGDILIRDDLNAAQIINGSVAAEVTVGDRINSFVITGGDLAAGVALTSTYGDIGKVQIKTGDLLGELHAEKGSIQTVIVGGSDLGAASKIITNDLANLSVDGTVMSGALVDIADEMGAVRIGGDVQAGAAIQAGSAKSVTVDGSMNGSVDIGGVTKATTVKIGADLGGDLTIAGDASVTVGDSLADGATLSVGGDLNKLDVVDLLAGDVFVDGFGGSLSAGRMNGAVVTTGFDLKSLSVADAMDNSLVQVGLSRGDDGQFADGVGVALDMGETGRMAALGALTVNGVMSDSIVAAGGDIDKVTLKSGFVGGSISSGLNLGSQAIAAVAADATPLADAAEQNAARSGADRELLRGDIGSAAINGLGMVGGALTAGVDAGASGDFAVAADNNVVSSITGGASEIRKVKTAADGASAILADAGVNFVGDLPAAGLIDADVTYDIGDLTAPNPVDLVGTATSETPLTYTTAGGFDVTVSVKGDGQVAVYDAAGGASDDVIDMIVITGADAKTQIRVACGAAGAVSIKRIVTGDDVALGSLEFDGALVGDAAAPVDLMLDGGVKNLSLGVMGDDVSWSGRIGGDVATLDIGTQALGSLRIGGSVGKFTLAEGVDDLWLLPTDGVSWADETIDAVASDSLGNVWLYDSESGQVHMATDVNGLLRINITDGLWNAVDIDGMDFLNAGDSLYAVSTVYNQTPSVQIGQAQDGPVGLVGLAVDGFGRVVAVEKGSTTDSGYDELVEIDPETGVRTTVGILRDVYSNLMVDNVQALAFDNNGRLYVLLSDYDGEAAGFDSLDGAVLAVVETTDINGDGTLRVGHPLAGYDQYPGMRIDGGGVTDTFSAMAVSDDGDIYAIRRTGGQDELVRFAIDDTVPGLPAVSMTSVGLVQTSLGDTNIVGMGFDAHGSLVAYNSDGVAADMIVIDMADPTASTYYTAVGILEPTIDAFAISRTDAFIGGWDQSEYLSYAYDTDNAAGSTLYTNPGFIQTLGTVDMDPASGQFLLLGALTERAEDENGVSLAGVGLSSPVVDIAVDGADTGLVFAVTSDGRLVSYSRVDGSFADEVNLANPHTGEIPVISAIDFDEASGDLVGLDALHHRLVTIDKATGDVVPRTESGSMEGDSLKGLTCDPGSGEFFTYDVTSGEVMQLRGIDHTGAAGVVATSIDSLNIVTENGYYGRISTTGNTFGKVNVTGDFFGLLASATDLRSIRIDGSFGGALTADGAINVLVRRGDFRVEGLVDAGETVDVRVSGGEFGGTVLAEEAKGVRTGGEEVENGFELTDGDLSAATIIIRGQADNVSISGDFSGFASFGSAGSVAFDALVDQAYVEVVGDAGMLKVDDGIAYGAMAVVGGHLNRLAVGGVFEGAVAVRGGLGSATLGEMNFGILAVAENAGSVSVVNAYDSLLSFGTWIGGDLIYNTEDDVITGGGVNNVTVKMTFQDSAIVAGVLPNLNAGYDIPADKGAYIGDPDAYVEYDDSAEAGGLLISRIGSVKIGGNVTNTSPVNGAMSVVAAADELGKVRLKRKGSTLRTRVYNDPYGAPTVVEVLVTNDSEIRVVFSEEVNSASFTLAVDVDGDGALASLSDILGSVAVRDANGVYLDGLQLDYTTQTADDGRLQGVLLIHRPGGFGSDELFVELLGGTDLGVYDRSGLRSSMRDPNQDGDAEAFEDRPGTWLDGDANGFEGGGFNVQPFYEDVSDDFVGAETVLFDSSRSGDYLESVEVIESLDNIIDGNGWTDVDVFSFSANAYEFFSVTYNGDVDGVSLGVFYLDDQGTLDDPADDSYELVARHEDMWYDPNGPIDEYFELPRSGEYFVAVGYAGAAVKQYSLQLNIASSDDMLDGVVDGATGVPAYEQIAYVSNKVGDHNNLLGANTPMQLVYLDFDGGQTTEYAHGLVGTPDVTTGAFDASILDPALTGLTDELINGTGAVTGIVDNIMYAYQNIPFGSINVQRIDSLAQWEQAWLDFDNDVTSGGLYFTTEDPSAWGLDAETDFTTVLFDVENTVVYGAGLLGIASNIDVAGQDKGDNALVFTEGFAGYAYASTLTDLMNQYSFLLANTAAHELGHTLGLQHQPTDLLRPNFMLVPDDPFNNPAAPGVSNTGAAIMAYKDLFFETYAMNEFGTLVLEVSEFPVGNVDNADQLVWWLS